MSKNLQGEGDLRQETAVRPVWLLDVDGVLNANKAGWYGPPKSGWITVDGIQYQMRWSPELMTRITRLHDTGLVDIRWATTWIGDTHLVEEKFGLPCFLDAYPGLDGHSVHDEMKRNAALEVHESGARLVWADDEAFSGWPQADVLRQAGHLLVQPDPRRGLRPEHMDEIETFVGAK